MKTVGEFPTFPEAFKKFHEEFAATVQAGASRMVLETTCWIECPAGTPDFPIAGPLYIYQLVQLAHALEYVDDEGKLVDPLPEIPSGLLRNVVSGLALTVAAKEIKVAKAVIAALEAGTPFPE